MSMAMHGHFQPNGETFIVIPTTGGLFSDEFIARQVYGFYGTQSSSVDSFMVLVAPFHHCFSLLAKSRNGFVWFSKVPTKPVEASFDDASQQALCIGNP